MKRLILFPLLFITVFLSAQPRVGFLLGGTITTSVDEMKFLNNPPSLGADIGITGSYSFLKGKLSAEVDAHFFNIFFRSRDNDSIICFDDFNRAGINIHNNTHDYGLTFPINLSYKIGKFKPFAGIYFNLSFSEEHEFESGMGDLTVGSTTYYSGTEGTISQTGSGLLLGCNFALTQNTDIRFSYMRSFNDYVSYHFLATVNDEPVVSEYMSTRVNKWGLSLVYTPNWKLSAKKKGAVATPNDKKSWIKGLYKE